jgi:two-component system LytT family response regulator
MNVLIIDDHKINRSLLKRLLNDNFKKITRVDEAESVSVSLKLLEASNYDLIFLDIELKDGIGFDVLNELTAFVYVIVISGHKEYAIDAFKHNVVDYLLKPINIEDFKRAVKKVWSLYEGAEKLKKVNNIDLTKLNGHGEDSLLLNDKNGYIVISKNDILFIKANGKCSEIFLTNGKTYTSYKNLKEFETVLSDILVRIHHSYLVNTKWIVYYFRETALVKLSTGHELPVSVRKKEELFKKFSLF